MCTLLADLRPQVDHARLLRLHFAASPDRRGDNASEPGASVPLSSIYRSCPATSIANSYSYGCSRRHR